MLKEWCQQKCQQNEKQLSLFHGGCTCGVNKKNRARIFVDSFVDTEKPINTGDAGHCQQNNTIFKEIYSLCENSIMLTLSVKASLFSPKCICFRKKCCFVDNGG